MEQGQTMIERKIRDMEISKPWSQEIFSGRKTIEMRKNNPQKWGAVKKGDYLRVKEKGSAMNKLFVVEETRTYQSLSECFWAEGVRHLLPCKSTIAEAEEVYLGFDGSGPDAIAKRRGEFEVFGCIVIELRPADPDSLRETDSVVFHHQPRDWAVGKMTYAAVAPEPAVDQPYYMLGRSTGDEEIRACEAFLAEEAMYGAALL